MRVDFEASPWTDVARRDLLGDVRPILRGVWREAAEEFFAKRLAREALARKAPKGLQPFLNRCVERRFAEAGWNTEGGRFWLNHRWVRVTFRHQMSIGSDIVDAIRFGCRSEAEVVAILAADQQSLRAISPNDANVLTSFEKVRLQVLELAGCLNVPLILGRLRPVSPLPESVAAVVYGARSRDMYVPGDRIP